MPNTLVLIHGYSDSGKSFDRWRAHLSDRYEQAEDIRVCDYRSLTNEVTIKDLAEGFDRALRLTQGLSNDENFDAIVHSTGMLVLRAWLTTYPERKDRLKHLIGLAPATFGSPLAKKGRSWLGSVFKGNKNLGPDFMEAGDLILDGLELASPYTWLLAEKDFFAPYYDTGRATPYVFIFCGTDGYSGILKLVDTPGTDGTVRHAGCGFNVRKVILDLTKERLVLADAAGGNRWRIHDWRNASIPVHLVKDLNHGTILSEPTDELVTLVRRALDVDSRASFQEWLRFAKAPERMKAVEKQWQQFIVRAMDERGDPIEDYNLQFFAGDGERVKEFDQDVAVYSGDSSYRCFHFDVRGFESLQNLSMRIIASSGSQYVAYEGHHAEPTRRGGQLPVTSRRGWDAQLDLTDLIGARGQLRFLAPFTTTLVELYLDREPLPLDDGKMSDLVKLSPV
jgi:pimeloyl-ACP methyl ester carboxylesterase